MKIKPEFADFHVTNIPNAANSKSLASVSCSVRRGYLVHFLKRSFHHTSPSVLYSHKHWRWSINVFLQTLQRIWYKIKLENHFPNLLLSFEHPFPQKNLFMFKKITIYQWSINLTLCALEGKNDVAFSALAIKCIQKLTEEYNCQGRG